MLNRRHIRVKVMQALFSSLSDDDIDINESLSFLDKSMHATYDLYLLMLTLMIEVQKKAQDYMQKQQKAYLATDRERFPNTAFINNYILHAISGNSEIPELMKRNKLDHWETHDEFVELIFREMLASELYQDYMKAV